MNLLKSIIVASSLTIPLFATNISDFINKSHCDRVIDKEIYKVCYSYKYKGGVVT